MDQDTLVDEEIAAGEELLGELEKLLPVRAGFWIKLSDEGKWWFYVAADEFNNGSLWDGYRKVMDAWNVSKNPNLDQSRVKLIGTTDPLARAVLDTAAIYDGKLPRRYHGTFFGGRSIDGSYFYPLPVSA